MSIPTLPYVNVQILFTCLVHLIVLKLGDFNEGTLEFVLGVRKLYTMDISSNYKLKRSDFLTHLAIKN